MFTTPLVGDFTQEGKMNVMQRLHVYQQVSEGTGCLCERLLLIVWLLRRGQTLEGFTNVLSSEFSAAWIHVM